MVRVKTRDVAMAAVQSRRARNRRPAGAIAAHRSPFRVLVRVVAVVAAAVAGGGGPRLWDGAPCALAVAAHSQSTSTVVRVSGLGERLPVAWRSQIGPSSDDGAAPGVSAGTLFTAATPVAATGTGDAMLVLAAVVPDASRESWYPASTMYDDDTWQRSDDGSVVLLLLSAADGSVLDRVDTGVKARVCSAPMLPVTGGTGAADAATTAAADVCACVVTDKGDVACASLKSSAPHAATEGGLGRGSGGGPVVVWTSSPFARNKTHVQDVSVDGRQASPELTQPVGIALSATMLTDSAGTSSAPTGNVFSALEVEDVAVAPPRFRSVLFAARFQCPAVTATQQAPVTVSAASSGSSRASGAVSDGDAPLWALAPMWNTQFETFSFSMSFGQVAVADSGMLVASVRGASGEGDGPYGTLLALHVENGTVAWNVATRYTSQVLSPPAIVPKAMFVAAGFDHVDDDVACAVGSGDVIMCASVRYGEPVVVTVMAEGYSLIWSQPVPILLPLKALAPGAASRCGRAPSSGRSAAVDEGRSVVALMTRGHDGSVMGNILCRNLSVAHEIAAVDTDLTFERPVGRSWVASPHDNDGIGGGTRANGSQLLAVVPPPAVWFDGGPVPTHVDFRLSRGAATQDGTSTPHMVTLCGVGLTPPSPELFKLLSMEVPEGAFLFCQTCELHAYLRRFNPPAVGYQRLPCSARYAPVSTLSNGTAIGHVAFAADGTLVATLDTGQTVGVRAADIVFPEQWEEADGKAERTRDHTDTYTPEHALRRGNPAASTPSPSGGGSAMMARKASVRAPATASPSPPDCDASAATAFSIWSNPIPDLCRACHLPPPPAGITNATKRLVFPQQA